ncbi:hypothetical protein BL248_21725 [Ralstonia solanacearum]|nr:hypothetical protein BL248_21725 [Ralstonia solanacearum]
MGLRFVQRYDSVVFDELVRMAWHLQEQIDVLWNRGERADLHARDGRRWPRIGLVIEEQVR